MNWQNEVQDGIETLALSKDLLLVVKELDTKESYKLTLLDMRNTHPIKSMVIHSIPHPDVAKTAAIEFANQWITWILHQTVESMETLGR